MTTTASERHLRLVFLLWKGGTKMTRRLLEKLVQDLKPKLHDPNTPWTVDCFLLQHESVILKSRLGREKSYVYFPGGCKKTDLDSWDLNMFCFILSKLCRLTDEILTVVDDLRDMRNELCHASDPSLEYDKYTQKLRKFKVMATQICKHISDDPFEKDINDFIAKVESEPLSTADIVTTMHKFYTTDRETKDALTTLSEGQKEVLAKIEEIHRILYNKDNTQNERRIKLPETDVEILVWNCNKEKEIKLSQILVNLIDQKIKESPDLADELSNDHMIELKKAVSEAVELFLSNGWKISSTENKCILLRVQCATVGNLVKLFHDCISGEISNLLKPVENAIRKIQDFDGVSLEAVICEEEFWRVASITISVLADQLKTEDRKPGATISMQVAQTESDIDCGTKLNLKIHHQTSMQRDKLIEAFKSGEVMTRMKNIEDAVGVDYDNVKIKAFLKSTDITAGVEMDENHPITIAYLQTDHSEGPNIEDGLLKCNSQRCSLREDKLTEDSSSVKTDGFTKTSQQEIDESEKEDTLDDPKPAINASMKSRLFGNSIISDKIDPESQRLPLVVASIDIGSTYSGYSWCFWKENTSVRRWTSDLIMTEKAPTHVLIRSDGKTVEAFGYKARSLYREMLARGERHSFYYFKNFKKNITTKGKKLDRNVTLTDDFGRSLPAIDIFAASIKFLKDDFIQHCKNELVGSMAEDEVQWVLTVPAIWSDDAKQFMTEAAIQAGIKKRRLMLVLEPEAASIYCRQQPPEGKGLGDGPASAFVPGTKYMIVDAGGGTVDITVHEVEDERSVKEVNASARAFGGMMVNDAFETLIKSLTGEEVYKAFCKDEIEDQHYLLDIFEIKKRGVSPTDNNAIGMNIPVSLLDLYETVKGSSLEKDVCKSEFSASIKLKGNKISFSADVIRNLFKDPIENIIRFIDLMSKNTSITAIIMAGGFSDSSMLQSAVKNRFPKAHVIVPVEAVTSVLKGALILADQLTSFDVYKGKTV